MLVVSGLVSIVTLMSLTGWQTFSERAYALRVRQQLMQDLHTAQVIAIERQNTLIISRLTDCAWRSSQQQDWHCGWEIRAATHPAQAALIHTPLQRPLRISAYPAAPIQINPRGDIVGVGVRWQFQLLHNDQASWLICLNAASRMRAVTGQTCS
jgi:Tfp pilus assembly protein FimT